MRRQLSRLRFLTLLLPLYCIFASIQVGCGGRVVPQEASLTDPLGGARGDRDGWGPAGGYGGYDDGDDDDYGYGYGSP